MRVYCIGDLHLPGNSGKPMDVFGSAWDDHPARVAEAWRDSVGPDDLVLVPGDISWAMRLEDARDDLGFIGSLPGKKLLLRGNHDYWWTSISKVRALLPEGCFALQGAAFLQGSPSGSRGWVCPAVPASRRGQRHYERELIASTSLGPRARAGG